MGNAISDVLYGDINPSGRLALTFPNKENEVGFTKEQWPGVPVSTGLESTYTEKLEVGYRWYDSHKVEPKFAFGFGVHSTYLLTLHYDFPLLVLMKPVCAYCVWLRALLHQLLVLGPEGLREQSL